MKRRFADALSKLCDISVSVEDVLIPATRRIGTCMIHGKGMEMGGYVTLSSCVVMVTYSPLVDLEHGRTPGSRKGEGNTRK